MQQLQLCQRPAGRSRGDRADLCENVPDMVSDEKAVDVVADGRTLR